MVEWIWWEFFFLFAAHSTRGDNNLKRTQRIIFTRFKKSYLNWNRNSKNLRYNLKPLTCLWTFVSWSKLFSKKAIFCFCAWLPPSSSVSVSTLVWKNKQTNKQTERKSINYVFTRDNSRVEPVCTRAEETLPPFLPLFPDTVILVSKVMVSPWTHLVKNHESQFKKTKSQV